MKMKGFLKRLRNRLPWNRRTPGDLPLEERARVRALMLGAGAPVKPDADGHVHIRVETLEVDGG